MRSRASKLKRASQAALAAVLLLGGAQRSFAAYDTVVGTSLNRLCPQQIGGDREYAGHGPEVTTMVGIQRFAGSQLRLHVQMHQKETVSDWSEASYNRDFILSQRFDGTGYTHIWGPDSSGVWTWHALADGPFYDTWSDFYIDNGWSLRQNFPPRWWLAEVDTMGDSSGNDIGNCTADDAYINVRTNTVYVWYQ